MRLRWSPRSSMWPCLYVPPVASFDLSWLATSLAFSFIPSTIVIGLSNFRFSTQLFIFCPSRPTASHTQKSYSRQNMDQLPSHIASQDFIQTYVATRRTALPKLLSPPSEARKLLLR